MAELYELNCAYMKMYNRSYRLDREYAESGDNYAGFLRQIQYVMSSPDEKDYFNDLKRTFIGLMKESCGEKRASYFHCRMENGEFIAEIFWKFVDYGNEDGDYVVVDRIEDADEIERYKVDFFYVDAVRM